MTELRRLPTALTAAIPGLYRLNAPCPALPFVKDQIHSIDVDCAHVRTRDDLLAALSTALEAPNALRNWDALLDAMRDLSWLSGGSRIAITVHGLDRLVAAEPHTFDMLVATLVAASTFWARHPDAAPIIVLEQPGRRVTDP